MLLAGPLRWPDVDLNRYLEPGEIVGEIAAEPCDARYLAWVPPDAYFTKGYLFAREEPEWPALLIGRSVLFEEHDVLGYSPIQLPRYWAYIRATNRLPVFYNASVIQVPTSRDLRLLGARYLVVRDGPVAAARSVRRGRRDGGRVPPDRGRGGAAPCLGRPGLDRGPGRGSGPSGGRALRTSTPPWSRCSRRTPGSFRRPADGRGRRPTRSRGPRRSGSSPTPRHRRSS